MHVLIVEDEPTNLELARIIMERLGHSVTLATDGVQAVDLVVNRGFDFDLVLMDVIMPVMDGLEAVRLIRGHAPSADVPILCVSAHAASKDAERCFAAGCDHFVTKPYRFGQAVDAIQAVLAKRPRRGTWRRVLIVEDDAALADEHSARLSAFGLEARFARSVPEAEAAAREVAPALMIVDLDLDGTPEPGLALIERMRADPTLRAIPVVVHSGYVDQVELPPVASFLPKPYSIAQLADALLHLRSGARHDRRPA